MGIATDVMVCVPPPSPLTPRADDRLSSAQSGGAFAPVRTTYRRRLEAYCRLNRPALVAVVGVSGDGSRLDVAWHPSLSAAEVDEAFESALTGARRPGSHGALLPQTLERLLGSLGEPEEQAFLALDARGTHRFGRPELFAEGLYLFRKKRGETS